MPECPICASPVRPPSETIDWSGYDCPRCGRWSVKLDAGGFELWSAREIGEWDTAEAVRRRSRLSHIFRRLQPALPSSRWAEVPVDNWRAKFLDNEPLPTPAQLLDNLILWIGAHQASIAESAAISVAAVSAWIGATITRHSPGAALGSLYEPRTPYAELVGLCCGVRRRRLQLTANRRRP